MGVTKGAVKRVEVALGDFLGEQKAKLEALEAANQQLVAKVKRLEARVRKIEKPDESE